MKVEDIDLLSKDLCGRLPYGVKCVAISDGYIGCISSVEFQYGVVTFDDGRQEEVCDIKPYLFPLGSHTSSEADRIKDIMGCNTPWYISHGLLDWSVGGSVESEIFELRIEQVEQLMEFFHLNHFDYRGLIEAGLAIDATSLNVYKEETK